MRRFAVPALVLSAAYFVALSVYLSSHRLMWSDEFLAWYVITDPSWRHALDSWNQAADSGGPLFYVIGRILVFVAGAHPLVLRLFSAGCLWVSAVLWFDLLRRKFSAGPALFACALVWLCDWLFVYYLGEVRFYGQLLLAVTLAAVAMVHIEDRKPSAAVCFLVMFATGSVLITSHMLGIFYGAFFVAALALSRLPLAKRAAAIGGSLGSWSLVFLFRTALKNGADLYTWVTMPHAMDLLRFHLHTPVSFAAHPSAGVLPNTLIALLIATGAVAAFRGRDRSWQVDDGRRLLLIFSALLLFLPSGLFVLSHLYKPVWVARYLMPYDLGLACFVAGALWVIGAQDWYTRLRWNNLPVAAVAAVALVLLHLSDLRDQPRLPQSNIAVYLSIRPALPLILQDADLFMQSRHYGGDRGSQIYYAMLPELHGTFDALAKCGYQPGLFYDRDFFAAHPAFLYLDIPGLHHLFLEHEMALHPGWRIRQVGTLPYYGAATPLLQVGP